MVHSLAILTTWSIWKQRNPVIFRDTRKLEQEIFGEIKDARNTWSRTGGEALQPLAFKPSQPRLSRVACSRM